MQTYRLLKIDEFLIRQYIYLSDQDECFYFMDYTPISIKFTPENDLIINFKKEMNRLGKTEWKYKGRAITTIANMFDSSLPPLTSPDTIFVPIPPSKIKSDPMYDNRMVQVLQQFCEKRSHAELREIISVKKNMTPSHIESATPEEIISNLAINKSLCRNQKSNIILVDDVITKGAHFKACKTLLQKEFPDSKIKGLFIARTIR